jgi:hypothetical protein
VLTDGEHTLTADDLPYIIAGGGHTLTYTPNTDATGADSLMFTVSSATATSSAVSFFLSITDPSIFAPTLSPIADQTVTAGATVTLTATATPALVADTITYSLGAGAPSGATIDANTGAFSWTTGSGDVGAHMIVLVATETGGASSQIGFTVTVNEAPASGGGGGGNSGGGSGGGGGGGGGGGVLSGSLAFGFQQGLQGDLNGDGHVDVIDFNTLMTQWGKTGSNLTEDINHDGIVDIFDFNILVANWKI